MPTVLVQGRIAAPHAPRLKRFAPDGWDVTVWDPSSDPVEAFEPLALEADVIVGGGVPIPWPEVPNLKLFQIPWTGFDFTAPAKMPPGVPVANTYEHETTIAEFIMAGILEMRVGLRQLDCDFRAGGWEGLAPRRLTHPPRSARRDAGDHRLWSYRVRNSDPRQRIWHALHRRAAQPATLPG